MTGHDLDAFELSPDARAFAETAEILAEPYNETIADLRAKLAAAEAEAQSWRADAGHWEGEYDDAVAKLAAAEQERDDQTWRADVAEALCAAAKRDKERAEAALAAVRELADLYDEDRDRTTSQSVASSIRNYIRRGLAAAEQDEPKRCEHVYPDGRRCALPPLEHHAVVGLAELHGIAEPKREQS